MRTILLVAAGLAAMALAGCSDSGSPVAGARAGVSPDQPSREILAALAVSEGQPQGQPVAGEATALRRGQPAFRRRAVRRGRPVVHRRNRVVNSAADAAR